jgi:hypothetical protein
MTIVQFKNIMTLVISEVEFRIQTGWSDEPSQLPTAWAREIVAYKLQNQHIELHTCMQPNLILWALNWKGG